MSLTPLIVVQLSNGTGLSCPGKPPLQRRLQHCGKAYKRCFSGAPLTAATRPRPPPPALREKPLMNEQSTAAPNSFAERLRQGRFVITAEVAPPVSCDA